MKTSRASYGYLLIAIFLVANSANYCIAQAGRFWVGGWCLMGTNDNRNDLVFDNIPPGSPNWYLKSSEKTKLENLGLNFMIACLSKVTADGEVGMNNYGIEKSGAFKSNMSISPPNASSPTAYLVWNAIREPGGPGNPTWENKVKNGWTSMNTLHSNKTGIHSFLAGAEAELNNPAKYPWLKFMCDSLHGRAPGVLALVQGGQPSDLNAFFQAVPSIDVYENGAYVLTTGLPYTGSTFQNALQSYVNEASRSISALKNTLPNVPLHFIIQTHWASGPCFNFRIPTQEEMLCQINLAIAYGAKGIVNYVYARQEYQCGSPPAVQIEEGLLDINRNPTSLYASLQSINTNYQSAGQSLGTTGANFLNLAWQVGFSIHQKTTLPISSDYKLYDVTAKPPGGSNDAPAETYVEVGVLQNSSNVNHYMVVNRRCTAGETREVTITFQTATNKVYRLTDVYTGGTITYYVGGVSITFPYTLTLGPGQGVLLKLEDLGTFSGSWSGNVTTNTAWVGTITVTTNVTVNSGVSLLVVPSSVIQFASGTSLTINGSLIAESNDPTKRITFTGTTATPGFWNGITINANANATTLRRCDVQYAVNGININYTGNSNNVTVDKCKIRNNSADGIFVSGNNYSSATVHPVISNNTISNNYGGIDLADYAKPTIGSYNRIENNSTFGLFGDTNCNANVKYNYIYNNGTHGQWFIISCNADVHRNTIKSNGTRGITCAVNSNVLACGANTDTTKGRNEIANNSGAGIYASSSSPNFGNDVAGLYGNNWIHDNTGYEAQQTGTGYQIRAKRCYWSGQQSNISGTVYTAPVLSSAPANPPAGWGRSTNYDPTFRISSPPEIIVQALPTDVLFAMSGVPAISQAMLANSTPINWTAELQAAIALGLNTGDWSPAEELIAALHRELQEARVPDVDFTLVDKYANDLAVADFIRKMLALVLMENDLLAGKTSDALTKLAAFTLSNMANTAEFLANTAVIHLYRLNDLTTAQSIFFSVADDGKEW